MSSAQHELGAGVSTRDEEEESRYVRYHEHRPQRETVHFAAEEGDIPRIKALVEAGILKGNSESVTLHLRELVLGMMPLHYAADHGRLETVEYLISRKVDINALDWSRVSPLHLCCIENHISVAKALLKAGADCKPADKEGDLPLHWAATRGHSQIIEVLMQYKSPVDPHNKAGWTPLHRAASNGRLEAIKKLLLSGAHINAKNKEGNTPLHLACFHAQLSTIQLLLSSGARMDKRNHQGRTPYDMCITTASRQLLDDMGYSLAVQHGTAMHPESPKRMPHAHHHSHSPKKSAIVHHFDDKAAPVPLGDTRLDRDEFPDVASSDAPLSCDPSKIDVAGTGQAQPSAFLHEFVQTLMPRQGSPHMMLRLDRRNSRPSFDGDFTSDPRSSPRDPRMGMPSPRSSPMADRGKSQAQGKQPVKSPAGHAQLQDVQAQLRPLWLPAAKTPAGSPRSTPKKAPLTPNRASAAAAGGRLPTRNSGPGHAPSVTLPSRASAQGEAEHRASAPAQLESPQQSGDQAGADAAGGMSPLLALLPVTPLTIPPRNADDAPASLSAVSGSSGVNSLHSSGANAPIMGATVASGSAAHAVLASSTADASVAGGSGSGSTLVPALRLTPLAMPSLSSPFSSPRPQVDGGTAGALPLPPAAAGGSAPSSAAHAVSPRANGQAGADASSVGWPTGAAGDYGAGDAAPLSATYLSSGSNALTSGAHASDGTLTASGESAWGEGVSPGRLRALGCASEGVGDERPRASVAPALASAGLAVAVAPRDARAMMARDSAGAVGPGGAAVVSVSGAVLVTVRGPSGSGAAAVGPGPGPPLPSPTGSAATHAPSRLRADSASAATPQLGATAGARRPSGGSYLPLPGRRMSGGGGSPTTWAWAAGSLSSDLRPASRQASLPDTTRPFSTPGRPGGVALDAEWRARMSGHPQPALRGGLRGPRLSSPGPGARGPLGGGGPGLGIGVSERPIAGRPEVAGGAKARASLLSLHLPIASQGSLAVECLQRAGSGEALGSTRGASGGARGQSEPGGIMRRGSSGLVAGEGAGGGSVPASPVPDAGPRPRTAAGYQLQPSKLGLGSGGGGGTGVASGGALMGKIRAFLTNA